MTRLCEEDTEVLRIGDCVRILECGCHETVQPRHTGQVGVLGRCTEANNMGDLILFPVILSDGVPCYAGDVELAEDVTE